MFSPARRFLGVALAMTCLFIYGPAVGPAAASPSPFVDDLNELRAAHGVPPARYSRTLARSASRFTRYLARTHQFTHGGVRRLRGFRKLGEILAFTRGWEVRTAQPAVYWLASSGHRDVLLNPRWRYIAAARSSGYYQGRPVLFWAVHFGR